VKNDLTPFLICLIGTDGSGKTTLADKLVNELDLKGYSAKYVWFRFPRFLTFVILLVSKLTGFTKYKNYGKYHIVLHYFHLSPFRVIYPLVVLVDMIAYYIVKVWVPLKLGYIIVCDRWVYDILIDVALDTRNPHFLDTFVGRLLCSFATEARIIFLLDAPDHVLNARRPEACLDPYTNERRSLYHRFSILSGVYSVNSNTDFDITWKNLLNLLKQKTEIDFETSGESKVYTDVKTPLLRSLVKNKYIVLVSNWTFRGVLIRTWSERLFFLVVDLIFAFPIFILLSFQLGQVTSAMLSLAIAHTFNWAFNGNLWAFLTQSFLKRTGRTYYIARNIEYLEKLEKKVMDAFGSIETVAVFGSLSRDEFSETSDIDIKIIRKPGMLNCVKANIFALYLRSTAFVKKIPLDLFVLDDINQLKKHVRPDEPPIVIYDPNNVLDKIDERAIPFRNVIHRYRADVHRQSY
jgi:thymidylate kinase/predicted nucleotidyltransferase